jgi:hypothetical protein
MHTSLLIWWLSMVAAAGQRFATLLIVTFYMMTAAIPHVSVILFWRVSMKTTCCPLLQSSLNILWLKVIRLSLTCRFPCRGVLLPLPESANRTICEKNAWNRNLLTDYGSRNFYLTVMYVLACSDTGTIRPRTLRPRTFRPRTLSMFLRPRTFHPRMSNNQQDSINHGLVGHLA